MLLLLIFSFISGLVTILAPCIWPLLPIILSATTSGGKRKPLGITLGIIISFELLTLSISYILKIIPFDPNSLRFIAVGIISILGIALIVPQLSAILEGWVSRLSGRWSGTTNQRGNGFTSGFITGIALGIVWSPCAGPILATIAAIAATQTVNFNVVLITTTYVIGIGIPLFLFASLGRTLFTKSRLFSPHLGKIQQLFGVIMLLAALAIGTNYDKVLQLKLLNIFPSYSNFITNFENNNLLKNQLDKLRGKISLSNPLGPGLFNADTPTPDFVGINQWLNTKKTLTMADLKGKVVLVDFWTYTCINCLRTLPHVTAWYDKYKNQGFVVIGMHTPEFAFEKETINVERAIKQFGIHYPVGQDNDYATWNNFSNQYWPAEYLIDANGRIRRTHFGEGEYDQTEMAIQQLLKESGKKISSPLEKIPDQTPTSQLSPETYLGAKRMQFYYPSGTTGMGQHTFTLSDPNPNSFSLGGIWNIADETAVAHKGSLLNYRFFADKVFIIFRPASTQIIKDQKVKIFLDGKLIDKQSAGQDVKDGFVTIDTDRLYNIVDLHGKTGEHLLKLEFESDGVQAFTFTFG